MQYFTKVVPAKDSKIRQNQKAQNLMNELDHTLLNSDEARSKYMENLKNKIKEIDIPGLHANVFYGTGRTPNYITIYIGNVFSTYFTVYLYKVKQINN